MSSSNTSNISISATSSTSETLNPTTPPPPKPSPPSLPTYKVGDTVFIVGDGSSCHEPSRIVSIEFNRRRKTYVYDAVPFYNPSLQGLFELRESDLRRGLWDVGAIVTYRTENTTREMVVVQLKFWRGRFCYRTLEEVGVGDGGRVDRERALEEKELQAIVEGKLDEMGGFEGIEIARKRGAGAHLSTISWAGCACEPEEAQPRSPRPLQDVSTR